MNTILKELLAVTKAQPSSTLKSRATALITTNTTTSVVAAVTGKQIKLQKVWVAARNDHASAVQSIILQDNADTPNIFAELLIGPTSQINGWVAFEGVSATDSGKRLEAVTATGTPARVRVVAYYDLV